MPVLTESQRRSLEKAVLAARDEAEAGARAAIQQLAVHATEPFPHLSPEERDLRNRLRARARQLGDTRNAKTGEHGIEHLVVECAYEHWHRMLFARFLAENNVLMHPDGVPVSLEECGELAPNEGAADGWELAARYAAKMLPQIFRPSSPIFELKLPPEKVRELERLLADLPPEIFIASDSLGWVYQFWQAKKKDEVNKSEVKIGADELPAVTQLFTEPYMVQFLLHNTLGAWWVGRHGRDSLPLEMPYLRFLDDGTPAAGTFDGWPKNAAELKVLDPCCGSGHFLVAAFEILVRFRMDEEGLDPAAASAAVLRDNLHGLEIDERCTQIAAFALALAAWTFPDAGGYRVLPQMHVACSGLAPRAKKSEWLALAGDDVRLKNGMERLYELFQDAPVLGSLIDPTTVGLSGKQQELGVASFDELRPLLDTRVDEDVDRREMSVAAQGMLVAADLLSRRFTLVATNVPYLAEKRYASTLKEYCKLHLSDAKTNLATAFIARVQRLGHPNATLALVSSQNWLFLSSYRRLRKRLLGECTWRLVANLGEGAFEMISGEVVKVTLAVINTGIRAPTADVGLLDVSDQKSASGKAAALLVREFRFDQQDVLIANPDHRIVFEALGSHTLLSEYAESRLGVVSGDGSRWIRTFWEFDRLPGGWRRLQSTPVETTEYGGRNHLIDWRHGGEGMLRPGVNNPAFGQRGVAVSQMGSLPATLYLGDLYDNNTGALVPRDGDLVPALWAFCSSAEYHAAVRRIDRTMKVINAALIKIPFDRAHWQRVAADKYPNGLPEPYSENPTQWIFKGTIHCSTEPLQVAVARLLGYRWPEQDHDGLDELLDDDGIVCLPAVRGEQPAVARLQRLLASAFGDEWSPHKQAELLESVGCKGWTLERWLNERFFKQHCDVFQNRPFIWHIWDGLKKGGFGALVNYHKLDRKLLETLTYNYLGDWIRRQEDGAKRGEDGADDRLGAARALQEKLKRILDGEPPCDIFVRWKPIEQQPMGWGPDINDGVRINIRPFMLVGDVGKKGAGILREKPNIDWGKDRGKDPSDAPWYDHFGGDRINDHHLTLAQKKAARDAVGGG